MSRISATVSRQQIFLKILRLVAIVLFVALMPVFLITSSVRAVINLPLLYSYGFDKYNIPFATAIERDELISAGRQIRDYFNNDEEFIKISVVRRGIYIDQLYNEREIIHMKDVKGLVKGVYNIQLISGLYMLAFAAVGFAILRRAFVRMLAKYVGFGGAFTLGLVLLVGLGAAVGFERLFIAFHEISFSNDFWLLDPSKDFLIAMFPESFFFDATMLIAGITIAGGLLLSIVPAVYLRWNPVDTFRSAGRFALSALAR